MSTQGGGHSHGGVPCHGHGDAAPKPTHGHSHGGVPCSGHGGAEEEEHSHSHGGHGHDHDDHDDHDEHEECDDDHEDGEHGHSHSHGGGSGSHGGHGHSHAAPAPSHGHSHGGGGGGHSHGGVPCHGHGPVGDHDHKEHGCHCGLDFGPKDLADLIAQVSSGTDITPIFMLPSLFQRSPPSWKKPLVGPLLKLLEDSKNNHEMVEALARVFIGFCYDMSQIAALDQAGLVDTIITFILTGDPRMAECWSGPIDFLLGVPSMVSKAGKKLTADDKVMEVLSKATFRSGLMADKLKRLIAADAKDTGSDGKSKPFSKERSPAQEAVFANAFVKAEEQHDEEQDGAAQQKAFMQWHNTRLRGCDRTGCGKQEAKSGEFNKCARCKQQYYCSKECQATAWKLHRPLCTAKATIMAEQQAMQEKMRAQQMAAAGGHGGHGGHGHSHAHGGSHGHKH